MSSFCIRNFEVFNSRSVFHFYEALLETFMARLIDLLVPFH
jgi:hypothetical protein